jgi:hypothetical protein
MVSLDPQGQPKRRPLPSALKVKSQSGLYEKKQAVFPALFMAASGA